MKPGDHVNIVDIIDRDAFNEEERAHAESFIGKRGVIIRENKNGRTGNTESDPLLLVAVHGHGRYEFWTEELEAA